MASTSTQATSTLLAHSGTLTPSGALAHLEIRMGIADFIIVVFSIICILGFIGVSVFILQRRSKPPRPPAQSLRERESEHPPKPHLPHKSVEFDLDGANRKEEVVSLGPRRMPSSRTAGLPRSRSPNYGQFYGSITPSVTAAKPPCPLLTESRSDEPPSTCQEHIPMTHLPRPSSPPRSKSTSRRDIARKPSVTSEHSAPTRVSTRSAGTIRGAPHHPFSNIEIVLPAPLAPQPRDHTAENPPAIQSYGQLPEYGSSTSVRWMPPLINTARWHPFADQDICEEDSSPMRRNLLDPECQGHHSLVTANQPRQLESLPQTVGRGSFHPIPPQPTRPGDPTTSQLCTDNRTLPAVATSQSSYGQATERSPERRGRQPHSKLRLNSQSQPFPQHQQSQGGASDLESSRYPFHSSRNYGPPWEEQPPLPVPPLPQLPQVLLHKSETHHLTYQAQPLSPTPTIMPQNLYSRANTLPFTVREDLAGGMLSPRTSFIAHQQ